MTDTTYTPRFPVPKGACDCHYHIFGPATRFPPNPEIQHLMPDALAADNAKMRSRVGIERMVLVQVGGYYLDNQPMLEVLEAEGEKARGIAAYDPNIEADEVESLNAAGVCGMRVSPGRDLSEERMAEVWGIVTRLARLFMASISRARDASPSVRSCTSSTLGASLAARSPHAATSSLPSSPVPLSTNRSRAGGRSATASVVYKAS